jgi:UDP-N-acetylmuramate dehydrogenase
MVVGMIPKIATSSTQSGFSHLEGKLADLQREFGSCVQRGVRLARYTTARVGGPAAAFLEARSADELARIVTYLWQMDLPFSIIGGGSNVLVSDMGLPAVVILNRTRSIKSIRFGFDRQSPNVWAESGVSLAVLVRRAAQMGFGGMEWASGVPGTLGGAVVGNAGAFQSDMASVLSLAEILHRNPMQPTGFPERVQWTAEQMGYGYRSSQLKSRPGAAVVLGALLRLKPSTPEVVIARMDRLNACRKETQPPGASMGSIFKNPPGDYAGRLIEAAGLKNKGIGGAFISSKHANFIINRGKASAADIYSLIRLAQKTVVQKFGVQLELEIMLLGDFKTDAVSNISLVED